MVVLGPFCFCLSGITSLPQLEEPDEIFSLFSSLSPFFTFSSLDALKDCQKVTKYIMQWKATKLAPEDRRWKDKWIKGLSLVILHPFGPSTRPARLGVCWSRRGAMVIGRAIHTGCPRGIQYTSQAELLDTWYN